mmetsp:Transcript_24177/g.44998  ORF Transcript_24177/g.44998 Transcript_24177/m.44998 type:complete len:208 (+) Transcript_24177:563-1186(+)
MCVHAFLYIVVGHPFSVRVVAPEDLAVGVFVVDRHDGAAVFGEDRHAVVVVPKGKGLRGGGAAGCVVKGRSVREKWIAPGHYLFPLKAFRDGDGVLRVGRNLGEAKPVSMPICQCIAGEGGGADQESAEAKGHHTTEEATAGQGGFHDVVKVSFFGTWRDQFVDFVKGQIVDVGIRGHSWLRRLGSLVNTKVRRPSIQIRDKLFAFL